MPVYSPTSGTHALTPTVDREGPGRTGQIPRQFVLEPEKGIPRYEDLLSLRVIERSPTISLPMSTVKDQITTTSWTVRPTTEDATTAHNEAADECIEFFDGNFNANGESFNHLVKKWINDILSPDTGTIEKVPTEPDGGGERWLAELYHLDGITMTKQVDRHGVIPEPPEPAYWQFAPRSALPFHSWDDVISKLGHNNVVFNYGRRQHKPISFSRDQVVWVETNPRPETGYGFGIVQQARRWAEVLLNVDISNRRYFSENEVPKGILSIAAGSQTELDRSRAYFQDTIRGQTDHIIPMFDAAPDDIDWTPIQGTPEELQFLDSQQWYHKLVWFLFGLNQGEIGDSADVNRSTAEEHSRQVYRQTTRPLLDVIAEAINDEILPAMEAYWRVDGELEFAWETEHEQMEELERRRQSEDLSSNIRTINEVRRDRGEEEVPWGDLPQDALVAFARKHPEWAAEQWGEMEDVPDAGPGDMDLFSAGASAPASATPNDSADVDTDAETDQGGGPGNCRRGLSDLEAHEDAGEVADEFPAVGELIGDLESETSRQIEHALEDVEDAVDDVWPEEVRDDAAPVVDLDDVVDDLSLRDQLLAPVVEHNTAAMQAAADQEADRLEDDLQEHFAVPIEVAEIGLDFALEETFAWEAMRRRAAKNMVSVEQTVRDRVRNVLMDVAEDGGNVDDATAALRESIDEISDNHSRLVARTELPQASREGTQALGEATDVVGGKEWDATADTRSRPWHSAMDGEVVAVDDSWTVPSGWQGEPHYQPADYPRAAHVVGEDQPFNCRCAQRNVLDDDLPEDLQSLADVRGVGVDVRLSDRQFEVWCEHAQPGETWVGLLERLDANRSRGQIVDDLELSKTTLYQWLEAADLR